MYELKSLLRSAVIWLGILAVSSLMIVALLGSYLTRDDDTTVKVEEPISDVYIEPVFLVLEKKDEVVSEPTTEIETEETVDYVFYDVPFDLETQEEIIKICSEYDISYELVLGVIETESSFRVEILGDGGDSFGLMQIQPKWWSETMEREGVTDLLDPLQNIRCGCAILQELKTMYGTEYRALQAYNTGRPDTNNGYAERVYKHVDELVVYGG